MDIVLIKKDSQVKITDSHLYNADTKVSDKIELTKVGIEIKPRKIMDKLLFFLPADSKWSRIIRRGIVIFLLAGISGVGIDVVQNSGSYIPAIWLPLITSILAMIDKAWRELAKE